jgi:hypothetical protein
MPIKTILTALILVTLPTLTLATGCTNGMQDEKQALSCIPGTQWDPNAAACVPVASS